MKIIIDIAHYPHINFYKNVIFKLLKKKIDVEIIIQPRGNLSSILEYEYQLPYSKFGNYSKSILGKFLNLIVRDFSLLNHLKKKDWDILTGIASINFAHVGKLFRKPVVIFDDDPEQKTTYYLYKDIVDYIVVPKFVNLHDDNIYVYNGYKELAYLHPNYFTPNKKILKKYTLKLNKYIFIREIERSSLNYMGNKNNIIEKIIPVIRDLGYDIVLSLEDKKLKNKYINDCIILEEPIEDFHSLLNYAFIVISSGDSMAREANLLGTPSIYTGFRDMAINREFIKQKFFYKTYDVDDTINTIKHIINCRGFRLTLFSLSWCDPAHS